MLKEQDELMLKIRNFNKTIINQKPNVGLVSDFLNNPSPNKKRKAIDIGDVTSVAVAADDDMSDISSNRGTVTEVSKK